MKKKKISAIFFTKILYQITFKMASVESIFVGCNRQLEILDYNSDTKELAYGANSLVALCKPFDGTGRGVVQTLKSHTKDVTCVKWVPNSPFLVSASEDSTVSVWKNGSLFQELKDAHKSSITALAVLNEKLFITGDADGAIIIWVWKLVQFVNLFEFTVKAGFFPLSLALEEVENGNYVLAIGGTNTTLYIYSFVLDITGAISDLKQCAQLQGHEDWIKAIAFKKESDSNWLIASGSQDRYIRLWSLKINDSIDHSDEDGSKLMLLSNKQHKFNAGTTNCAINFDAIIMGHDDWISSLIWHPTKTQLLSSSADTSIMIWEPDTVSGIWISTARLGEISIKGASTATGASGGFWGATWIFDNDFEFIFTNGKTGSLRLWKSPIDQGQWEQLLTVTGCLKPITDLSWSENGEYLLTTSLDQTTRLFSNWKRHGKQSWHEFARPQIHGYDMICVSPLSNTRFVSGGDEKILRSFDLPKSVSNMLAKLCSISLQSDSMPEMASLPVLGLSNKAETEEQPVNSTEQDNEDQDEEETGANSADILSALEQPPLEDVLQRHTLFPEIEKLYGHGYEITTVATSKDKSLIATACRSNSVQQAVIRIFQTSNWQQLETPLKGHNLTVTRLAFSPSDKYLVGVSRDRQFSLWSRDGVEFSLVKLMEKAHTRIIWDVLFVPTDLTGQESFITVSRDKTIKLWEILEGEVSLKSTFKTDEAITACDSLDILVDGKAIIFTGSETGNISVYSVLSNGEITYLFSVDNSDSPNGRVNRLSVAKNSNFQDKIRLASGSDDCSVRIFSFSMENLSA